MLPSNFGLPTKLQHLVPRGTEQKNLGAKSILYFLAAICQTVCLYIPYKNSDLVLLWLEVPIFGTAFLIVWAATGICIIFLLYISFSLYRISKKENINIFVSSVQNNRWKKLRLLMILGIVADLTFFFLLNVDRSETKYPSNTIFLSVMTSCLILRANMEAVMQYFEKWNLKYKITTSIASKKTLH